MSGLLDLSDAQERLLALAPQLGEETVAIEEAIGRVLAHDLRANRTQPPADLSAMDGYALCGAGPWTLVGESRAGAPFEGKLAPSEAVRISTGAHMPDGAESVLIQENASVADATISADQPPTAGKHVRKRGFDFSSGDIVLEGGTRLGPAQLALAIAAGHAKLTVRKRPRVAVLDSGDELSLNPENCGPSQIPASNGAMIAAMLNPLVGRCERIGPVGDDMDALAAALAEAEDCDILITSGGASVGDHDLVQSALREWGADIAFWKVAIRPGKPLMVAKRGAQVVLGLPGNPVSSFVTAFLFALPLVRAAMGMRALIPGMQTAMAAEAMPATGGRREFVRGVFDGQRVRRAASQDSSAIRSLAAANCLIERPAGSSEVAPGDKLRIYNLENG
ncbi:molybdopterin biosynthesis protein [Erythrobacter sp. NAP1]|uniref:molybdopterin molybdotransferase MoeA n=1 Tax=Erythrobacter sp. NAP1 TaxID=237727 RepID=UPI0000686A5A|nr:gephyrin-like molybdotransferase Glp [Erythrobacter sp. NAP1]EAQ30262.1 molybdopterin biosynthesis protein [Erythrobacter sp. NAP1]